MWLREDPARLANTAGGAALVAATVKRAAALAKLKWRETNYLLLERGPYVIAAGLDESIASEPKTLRGHFVNLFDPELRVLERVQIEPGQRYFLRDLKAAKVSGPHVLASACKTLEMGRASKSITYAVEGVARTPTVVLLRSKLKPTTITLDGQVLANFEYSAANDLVWIRFENESWPRTLVVTF
jgi:hypothetical protein